MSVDAAVLNLCKADCKVPLLTGTSAFPRVLSPKLLLHSLCRLGGTLGMVCAHRELTAELHIWPRN